MYKSIIVHESDIREYLNKAYYENEYELDNIVYKGNNEYLLILKRYFR